MGLSFPAKMLMASRRRSRLGACRKKLQLAFVACSIRNVKFEILAISNTGPYAGIQFYDYVIGMNKISSAMYLQRAPGNFQKNSPN